MKKAKTIPAKYGGKARTLKIAFDQMDEISLRFKGGINIDLRYRPLVSKGKWVKRKKRFEKKSD